MFHKNSKILLSPSPRNHLGKQFFSSEDNLVHEHVLVLTV